MPTDLERLVSRAVRTLSDAVPVAPPDPDDLIRRATADAARVPGPRRVPAGRWLVPVLTAAAVLGLFTVAALGPVLLPTDGERDPADTARTPVIPTEVAPQSLLTASVSDSPAGPALLAYMYDGGGPRWLPTGHTIVVGADGRSYRHVDEAERRGAPAELGTWRDAPVSLSPDGTRLAVGSVPSMDTLSVVDLRTGEARRYPVTPVGAIEPLAWSPDGTRVAYTVRPVVESGPPPAAGEAAVLHLHSGVSRPLPVRASAAAFSPDGTRIAVQGDPDAPDPAERAVRIVERNDTVTILDATGFGVRLAGPAAWSPSGRYLAVVDNTASGKRPSTVSFLFHLPNADAPGLAPFEAPTPDVAVVGWRAADRLLVTEFSATDDGRRLYEVTLGGQAEERTLFERGLVLRGQTGAVQAATALVDDAEFRAAGSPDRGPWPWWLWLTFAVAVAAAVSLTYLGWRPVRRWSARSSAPRASSQSP